MTARPAGPCRVQELRRGPHEIRRDAPATLPRPRGRCPGRRQSDPVGPSCAVSRGGWTTDYSRIGAHTGTSTIALRWGSTPALLRTHVRISGALRVSNGVPPFDLLRGTKPQRFRSSEIDARNPRRLARPSHSRVVPSG